MTNINWKNRTDHPGSKTVLICHDLILCLQEPFLFAKLENVSNKFRNVNIPLFDVSNVNFTFPTQGKTLSRVKNFIVFRDANLTSLANLQI